jgi:NLR family CARD domain-containing protein 3
MQINLSENALCGIDRYGRGTYNADGIKAIADAIAVSASVTCLDVRYNSISGDGASQLSAAVLGNPKMEKFNEIPIKDMRTNSLTKLNLSGKEVGVVGGMVVAGLLPVMPSVTSVRVFGNSWSSGGRRG